MRKELYELSYSMKRDLNRKISKVILFIVLTVLVINLVLNFLIFPVRQTSVSMLPDFTKNSCIFFTPLKKSFERGDVVLLSSNDTENLSFFEQILDSVLSFFSARQFSYAKREHYMGNQEKIRRIIALPGDSIYMRDYIVYIKPKGEKHYLTEYEIIKKTYNINVNVAPSSWDSSIGVYGSFDEIVLGEDEYFVLGDNRNSSVDSRLTGPVKKQGIKASSVFQFFPLSKIKIL
ncbi:MAG: signal peptidase I [Treponema sp.]|nr:signal peptidase I [Treponema sp.]